MTSPRPAAARALRVLFLCTGNSARSQLAEAVLNRKGVGRFHAESAGSRPAARVNLYAVETLRIHGYEWLSRPPRGLDSVLDQQWDFVITVCDRARESCPIFPGQPMTAHWGMPDPAEVEGTDQEKRRAFNEAFLLINRRIDLLLALPMPKLERLALKQRIRAIGDVGALESARPER
jgi:arsenate reductase